MTTPKTSLNKYPKEESKAPTFLPDFLTCLFQVDANQPHDRIKFHIVDCLKRHGFQAFAEYHVSEIIRIDSNGRRREGRLDFYANRGSTEIVGEIDRSMPLKKSVQKCSKYPNALKLFVLRSNKIEHSKTREKLKDIKNYLVIDLKRHKIILKEGLAMTMRKELFSERVSAGNRTYFFDVKESVDGAKYLVINESKKVGETHEHNRVMVFEEDILAFNNGLKKAVKFISEKSTE